MEPTSAFSHRGAVPWHMLLLTASLLTFWGPPTTAQQTSDLHVKSVPPNAIKGKEVLLLAEKLPETFIRLDWFRGDLLPTNNIASLRTNPGNITNGPAHSGRDTLYSNGSLLIQNLIVGDTGSYWIQVITVINEIKHGKGELHVYELLPKPHIESSFNPMILTCEPKSSDTTYKWFIKSQPLQPSERLQVSLDRRTLSVKKVTRNDTGPYECETSNPVSVRRSDPLTVPILYGPDPPIIFPTKSYYSRGANLSLSCSTASHPPAQFSWVVCNKPLGSTQTLSIPNLSLSDSGSYSCIVSNSARNISRRVTIHIAVLEEESTIGMPVWTFLGILIGVSFGVKLTAVVGYCLLLRFRRNQEQHDSIQLQPTLGSLGLGAPSNS